MKPAAIKIARDPMCNDGPPPRDFYLGWFVDGTEETFAIDERYPAEPRFNEPAIFAITHIPTGRRLWCGAYFNGQPPDAVQAINIAQGFYRECKVLGWDMKRTDANYYYEMYRALTPPEINHFWMRVKHL